MSLDTTVNLAPGTYASIPAVTAVAIGALYPATDRGIIYRNTGAAWVAWGIYDVAAFNVYTGYLELAEAAAPSTPASGKSRLYAKSDGLLYWKDDGGVEHAVSTTTGTVTSVAQSVPAELSVSGSPITSSGTLALTWASGTGSGGQGKFIGTPSGGGSGAYAGRVLAAGDIPALPLKMVHHTISTNTTIDATYGTIEIDASGGNVTVTLPSAASNAGKVYMIAAKDVSGGTALVSAGTDNLGYVGGPNSKAFAGNGDAMIIWSDGSAVWFGVYVATAW